MSLCSKSLKYIIFSDTTDNIKQGSGIKLLTHEFGIMNEVPEKIFYSKYEPEKYNCISVDDELVLQIAERISEINMYWHTLDRLGKGLAYYGITLIPPSAFSELLSVVEDIPDLRELTELLKQAKRQNAFVIHFGV